jgi:hypothetical protein
MRRAWRQQGHCGSGCLRGRSSVLDLDRANDRVEQSSVLLLLEDRAGLGRRCGFADAEIAELAGVTAELVTELLTASGQSSFSDH